MNRRDFIASSAALAGTAYSAHAMLKPANQPANQTANQPAPAAPSQAATPKTGRLRHSVCQWCFGSMPLDELAKNAAAMGIQSVELLMPEQWDTLKPYGLTCAVAGFVHNNRIHSGWNRVENHDAIIKDMEYRLPQCKAAGIPNQIVFSGNRDGMNDLEGLKNCAKGLKRLTPLAEQLGVTLVMELLNSKRDHKDYMCDRTPWGVNLVKEVGSPRFKLLYDIYHMQIMEGDVIATILENYDYIAHYHTAGVPGRREIDEKQELNYRAICTALADKGFQGYFAQEFMPVRDPMASLKQSIEICTV
ncbi:MAG: TIM barrel protein [Phycisphaerales bacterium]|nr:TIM barrel protein [Phycisphaerales bacterium]